MFSKKLFQLLKIKSINKMFAQQTVITKRFAGNFKRSPFCTKVDQLLEIRNTYFHNRMELSKEDWQNVTELLIKNYKHINKNNVAATIVGVCGQSDHLSLAKSYIKYLKENGTEPNDATLGKLLRIYNATYHARGGTNYALAKEEQEEVLNICQTLKAKHNILDSLSCENLICGLVTTDNWKDGVELLEMMRISSNVPSSTAYTELIIKAFATNSLQLGWQLLQRMLEEGKQPKCEIFTTLLETILNKNVNNFYSEVEKLLMFLEAHNFLITEKVATMLLDIALQHPNLLVATASKLKGFGKCSSCGLYMKNVALSDEDFKMLQDSFLNKVLIRKDIFQKSTPEEVKQFCDYIDRTGPYDCVIDGLNVAYSMGSKKPKQALANLLASVVKYYRKQNKHILVLGRKHMDNWPNKTMQYIKSNSAVFLTKDLSQDDPFLLYATLKSGQSTDFFSRDFMRQHAFLLGSDLKVIFRRWQQEHQYALLTQTETGKIIVKEPIRHLICAHKVEDTWHVPYKMEFSPYPADSFEKPERWLCLKLVK